MRLPSLTDAAAWSVCVRDARTSAVLTSLAPDDVRRTASVGKVFLLVEVARQAEAGDLDLDELLAWREDELVADSGLWLRLRSRRLPADDLCWLVGAVSDNLATNVLLRRVGVDAVRRTSEGLGCHRSALLDRVRDDRGPDDPPTLSQGAAGELSQVLAGLHRGEVVSVGVSQRVLAWLSVGTDLSMVASAFGLDPLAHAETDRGVLVVNKTGTIGTVRADVGLVTRSGGGLAYAVLAEWELDAPEDTRDLVLADMAAIGRMLRTPPVGQPSG